MNTTLITIKSISTLNYKLSLVEELNSGKFQVLWVDSSDPTEEKTSLFDYSTASHMFDSIRIQLEGH